MSSTSESMAGFSNKKKELLQRLLQKEKTDHRVDSAQQELHWNDSSVTLLPVESKNSCNSTNAN